MKFIIKHSHEDSKPCKGAVKEKLRNIEVWTIEINTLEDLIELRKQITTEYNNYPRLFIDYDDYYKMPELEIFVGDLDY